MSGDAWDRAIEIAAASTAEIGSAVNELGSIGGSDGGAVSRPGFTPEERRAHDTLGRWLTECGMETRVDPFGNTIGTRAGTGDGLPALAVGSHLDSVVRGGRFDGAAGVIAAAQCARVLHQAGVRMRRPLWIVAWVNEEGARFGEPCLGSKAVAGELTPQDADRLRDGDGVTLAEAMRSVGFDPLLVGESHWDQRQVAAYLELHIEQARVLETLAVPIGLVDVIAGSVRIRATIVGRPDHSGGTPMDLRQDALAGAAEMIALIEREGRRPPSGARATVGRLQVTPNSITTIPGKVLFYVDVRDIDARRLSATSEAITTGIAEIAERRGLKASAELISRTAPTHLWVWLRNVLRDACRESGLPWHIMPSGAGHDAQVIARHIPSAMVFVPSHNGSSHVPEEWTEPAQIAAGVQVLVRALRKLDA